MYQILVINPGSTSTKVALYGDKDELFFETIHHSTNDLQHFTAITDQQLFRTRAIEDILEQKQIDPREIDAYVGRGGLIHPIPSGTYKVCDTMNQDLIEGVMGDHASNLGGILARHFADHFNKPAFIVDPVVVDELEDIARFSGCPIFKRKSIFHALNQKAVGRKVAAHIGKPYEDLNLIIAHLGGGISIAAHRKGRVVDVNNALDGEGPFTPERSGTLPTGDLVKLAFSGTYTFQELYQIIKGKGGMVGYLETNDMRRVSTMIANGDSHAEKIYRAMAYQVAKYCTFFLPALQGQIDGIVLTGGIAHDSTFVEWITDYIGNLTKVFPYPGEFEMEALALGALRVLNGKETAKDYKQEKITL